MLTIAWMLFKILRKSLSKLIIFMQVKNYLKIHLMYKLKAQMQLKEKQKKKRRKKRKADKIVILQALSKTK